MSTQLRSCVIYSKLAAVVVLATGNKLIWTWHQLPAYGNQNPWAFLWAPFFPSPLPSPLELPVHKLTWNKDTACTSKNGKIAGWSSKLVFSLTRATRPRHHERITCFCLPSFRPSTATKKVMQKIECNIWRTHMTYLPRNSHFTTRPNI